MGLDQHWVEISAYAGEWDNSTRYNFYYHRKVPALQAFMEDEWRNTPDGAALTAKELARDFNCVDLEITPDILDRLEAAIENNGEGLNKDAAGFFFGKHYDSDIAEIREAIVEARTRMAKDNRKIVYTSWW